VLSATAFHFAIAARLRSTRMAGTLRQVLGLGAGGTAGSSGRRGRFGVGGDVVERGHLHARLPVLVQVAHGVAEAFAVDGPWPDRP
jgi:hypothetical protein